MDTEKALLQAIEDNPGDDASWLVLSDLLEEQGAQNRAELMRLQVRLRRDLAFPDRPACERRLPELLCRGVQPCAPRRSFTLSPAVSLELMLIPPGSFQMGSPATEKGRVSSEGPVHRVTLTKAFWMGIYPVTTTQWWVVMGTQPSPHNHSDRPVARVSWNDSRQFCARLGKSFRLPTEAEWEYACRAGTSTSYSIGERLYANCDPIDSRGRVRRGRVSGATTPVGQYLPNAFGLCEMHGNVWEWCDDWFGPYSAEDAVNPRGPDLGDRRVVRGGCWQSAPRHCRSAHRGFYSPDEHEDGVGCRVVMEAPIS